ncbi:helicase, partial [Chytridiales sp. JEL 0842]
MRQLLSSTHQLQDHLPDWEHVSNWPYLPTQAERRIGTITSGEGVKEAKRAKIEPKTLAAATLAPSETTLKASVVTGRAFTAMYRKRQMKMHKILLEKSREAVITFIPRGLSLQRAFCRLGKTTNTKIQEPYEDYTMTIGGKDVQIDKEIDWNLFYTGKQSPYPDQLSVAKRVLVVSPANWQKEFRKWLGDERIKTFVLDDKADIADFLIGRVYQVLICSYERLRVSADKLIEAKFDIIIADEGHRLKNSQNQATRVIQKLGTLRRVVLTGTPLQNDLGEFFNMCDLVNPGIFGTHATFQRVYETPIVVARDSSATPEQVALGHERGKELVRLSREFVLRRTSESITKLLLPKKTEFILFAKLESRQEAVYKNITQSPEVKALYLDGMTSANKGLGFITMLRKAATSTTLIDENAIPCSDLPPQRPDNEEISVYSSSKFGILFDMLRVIKDKTTEKVVIVSNWTQTLDLVTKIMDEKKWTYLRLDGRTNVSNRQSLVDRFNNSNPETAFCFLLSAKAGGMGISLCGASRLFLLDIDWNPAVCLQAMARIWREGQKREVKIYRLISADTIEEKILQRQMAKMELSDAIIDDTDNVRKFTKGELKDLFTYSVSAE